MEFIGKTKRKKVQKLELGGIFWRRGGGGGSVLGSVTPAGYRKKKEFNGQIDRRRRHIFTWVVIMGESEGKLSLI